MASSIPSMEFTALSSSLPRNYDVLINFTGEDIHRKFVSHLDSALSAVGFTTFLHHQNAVKPMHIQEPIVNLCRVAIVVFTKTYSESAWCLHQLQQIVKWHETCCQHVLPVYYEIAPSDVRLQQGDFGKAFKATAHQTFSEQELEHGMSRWSHALTKVANCFGWDESNYRSDAEVVNKIIKSLLNLSVFSATKFPVGLQSRVENVIRTIKSKSTKVCIIGICGEEGSGKTTLAKAIYNQIQVTFRDKSFIEDITRVSGIRGTLPLQEQLLLDVLKTRVEIPSLDMGSRMIQERLSGKKVLIVLDDVPEFCKLLDLLKCRNWFSGGTVIIVTAEDLELLKKHRVDYVFRMKPMNDNESLELLSWHALREAKPKQKEHDYLARRIAIYCLRLPLILEVIGSNLFERTKEEWYGVLRDLEKIGSPSVEKKLNICFKGLQNQMVKDLFLYVSRFFVGKGRNYATKILNGCQIDVDIGIRVLLERNLLKVTKNNKFGMHPLLQEMGLTIIREISEKDPSKNRPWLFDKDTKYGTKATQLLLQKLDQVEMSLNPEYLLQKLRWISPYGFYSEYLDNKFCADDAIAFDQFAPQVLRSLKVLNLSHSNYLTTTPDFTRLPCLEQLILKCCRRLRKVHQSIGCLCNLLLLDLKDCTSLSNLPKEIYKLKSLRTLNLSGCSKIDLMDKDIAQLESLTILIAENTTVKHVPFSVISSKSIGYICLRRFEGLSHNLFPSIIRSWMSQNMNLISYMHLFCMDKEDNSWDDIVPSVSSSLRNLRSVLVQCNTEFQLSKQVKSILVEYFANTTESGISKHRVRSSLIGVGRCNEFFNSVSYSISEVLRSSEWCEVSLPTVNDPCCLAHMGEGHSVSFIMPQDRDMKGMALCVVYLSTPEVIEPEFTTILIVNHTKCTFHIHNLDTIICFNDEDWNGIRSNLGCGDRVEMFVSFGNGLVVKNTAVYLICGESKNMEKALEPNKHSLTRFIKKVVM